MVAKQAVLDPAALSAEHRIFNHIKHALRVMVEWQAPAVSASRKRSSVRFALRSFCRHLERLMQFEEQGGYLPPVATARPNWERQLSHLRQEHTDLRQRINRLVPQLADEDVWQSEKFDSACAAIRQLLDEVDRHDRDERALLQETLLWDEGGEG
ncbi:hemerythrin domain-containing protein [Botrimarina sp.]|uniref:hemerythrin domain-containing protein n=1 Tax=Botrimarina sp. TaxID=2795802 RepID=UPI0032EEEA38